VERGELAELHYIVPLANVRSIVEHGILSHVRAQRFNPISVAAEVIQDRRANVQVPGGRPLHQYANLYFHARNPMLYLRKDMHAEICVLRIGTTVLDLPGVVITDANASSGYSRFAAAPDGLAIVNRDLTFAEYWADPDDDLPERLRRKSAKNAEVLVPDRVAPGFIVGAYLSCEESMQGFTALGVAVTGHLSPHLFFR
jgi:hypothetical protein